MGFRTLFFPAILLVLQACANPNNPGKANKQYFDSVNTKADTVNDTIWYTGMMRHAEENSDSIIYIKTWEGIHGDSVRIIKSDIEATLRIYAPFDHIRLGYWEALIETGTINKIKFGFVSTGDTLHIYRLEQKECRLIRSLNLEITVFGGGLPHWSLYQVGDLNFDGYDDVVVQVPTYGVHGNSDFTILLFDPTTNTFNPARGNPIENLSVDRKNKYIRGKHFSSICGGSSKIRCRVVDDSIICSELITIHSMCDGIDQDSADVDYWKYDGATERCDSIRLPSKRAWKKFSTTLWNSENNWGENSKEEQLQPLH